MVGGGGVSCSVPPKENKSGRNHTQDPCPQEIVHRYEVTPRQTISKQRPQNTAGRRAVVGMREPRQANGMAWGVF